MIKVSGSYRCAGGMPLGNAFFAFLNVSRRQALLLFIVLFIILRRFTLCCLGYSVRL